MYLASLNSDLFFKKVFGEIKIAKQFLEDFLDTEILMIEAIKNRYKITDSSRAVEFDFRCVLADNKHVIIDMQQWYKADIIPRFYTYHALNTSLQLEKIGNKVIPITGITNIGENADIDENNANKKNTDGKEIFNYFDIMPVITIVWLVNDNLGCKTDYSIYSMIDEEITNFIYDDKIWQNKNIDELLKVRAKLLLTLRDDFKRKDFLNKNKLMFAYQDNIVKNITDQTKHKENNKYVRWFEFAKKTLNKNNVEQDFTEYNDPIFKEIINRLITKNLVPKEQEYIKITEREQELVKVYEQQIKDEGIKEGNKEGKKEGIKEGKEEGKENGIKEEKEKIAKKMLAKNKDIEEITEFTGLTGEEIDKLRNS